jgi:DNA-3-methyladenine glycosylase II
LAADPAENRLLQFTSRKAEYIVRVAEEIASGRLTLAGLSELPDEEIVRHLTSLRGIGLWSAEWVLARTLGRPCVVASDLGVRRPRVSPI